MVTVNISLSAAEKRRLRLHLHQLWANDALREDFAKSDWQEIEHLLLKAGLGDVALGLANGREKAFPPERSLQEQCRICPRCGSSIHQVQATKQQQTALY